MRKPFDRIHELAQRLDDCQGQAQRAVKRRLTALGRQLAGDAARLESLSPLAVLARGYSVTQREGHNEPLREAVQLQPGDVLLTRFHRGRATSRVESVELESLQSKKSMESS